MTLTLACSLALAGCGKSQAEATSQEGGRPGAAQKRGGNGGPPPLQTMAVAVEPASRSDIATYYRATASLDPDKEADVLVRVQGMVKRILVEEGHDVRQGQLLLQVDDTEYRHRLTQAQVALDQTRAKHARVQSILAQGLVSVESADNAKAELDAAEAAYELAALELSWCDVRAPFSGRIVRRHVDQGQNVSNGTPLFAIADMHRLLARVHVPAREFRSIRTDQPVELLVDSTGDRMTGRIDLVSPIVDPRTGTIKVTVEILQYPPSTRPGNFAEVSIVTDVHENVLVVPNVAVLTDKDQRVVYVADGETAKRQVVEIGYQDDRFAEILRGLDDGTPVVIQGQRSLADGQPIRILDRLELDAQSRAASGETGAREQGTR